MDPSSDTSQKTFRYMYPNSNLHPSRETSYHNKSIRFGRRSVNSKEEAEKRRDTKVIPKVTVFVVLERSLLLTLFIISAKLMGAFTTFPIGYTSVPFSI